MVLLMVAVGLLSGVIVGAAIVWLLEKVVYKMLCCNGVLKLVFLISVIGVSLFLFNLVGKLFN